MYSKPYMNRASEIINSTQLKKGEKGRKDEFGGRKTAYII